MTVASAAEMLIIADDLSGAADCGIACTAAGLDTVVLLDGDAPVHAEAIAIDLDTRRKPPREAAAETARAVRAHAAPGQILFKKLDSTLRGNFGVELAAALAARRAMHGPASAVMAPAFPSTGRTTAGGHQLLHGVRLEHTEIWRGERIEGTAYLPAMAAAAGLSATVVPLGIVRDPRLLRAALADAAPGHDVLVCDAETDADLCAIAEASLPLGRNTVWVGSAGLAHHLPGAAGLLRPRPPAALPQVERPVLFVVGSVSNVTRRQVAALAAGIALVTVPADVLRAGAAGPGWDGFGAALLAELAAGRDAVVQVGAEGQADLSQGLALCRALAQFVAPLVQHIGALVATGGETARAVLQAFGVSGLRLLGEVEPGVPVSVTTQPRPLPVITKAGAFGHPDTLLRCRAALRPAALTQAEA